jgi:hypothetical protein
MKNDKTLPKKYSWELSEELVRHSEFPWGVMN